MDVPLANTDKVALIDDEDWPKVSQHSWCLATAPGGYLYAKCGINGKTFLLHRFLLNGSGLVRHLNGNGLDCRKSNLSTERKTHKVCPRCKKLLPREAFGKNGSQMQAHCKPCAVQVHKEWLNRNPAKKQKYSQTEYYKLKAKIFEVLGSRCVCKNCRWLNEDGTLGCKDEELLHIEHKYDDGAFDRRVARLRGAAFFRHVLKHIDRFQLFCANCNTMKARALNKFGHNKKEWNGTEKYEGVSEARELQLEDTDMWTSGFGENYVD